MYSMSKTIVRQREIESHTTMRAARINSVTIIVTHLLVDGVDELRQCGQGGADVFEAGLRLSPAEVGQRPGGVSQHGQLGSVGELLQQRAHCPLLEDQVAAHGGVTSDVPEGPDLLPSEIDGKATTIKEECEPRGRTN